MKPLIETLAAVEHEQWMRWSQNVRDQLKYDKISIGGIFNKWKANWIPYLDLTEENKEKDRVWVKRIKEVLLEWANDHYWDSLEKEKLVIIKHLEDNL